MSRRTNTEKEIKKVTDINKSFIENFIHTQATREDVMWIQETKRNCTIYEEREIRRTDSSLSDKQIEAKARRQYFGAFRSAFAKRFYPELFAKKIDKKNEDTIELAIEARLTALSR